MFISSFILCLRMDMSIQKHTFGARTTLTNQFSPSTMRTLGMKLRLSGLVANIFPLEPSCQLHSIHFKSQYKVPFYKGRCTLYQYSSMLAESQHLVPGDTKHLLRQVCVLWNLSVSSGVCRQVMR